MLFSGHERVELNAGYCAGRDNEFTRFKKGKQFSKCCKFSVLGDEFCLACSSCTLAVHSPGDPTTGVCMEKVKFIVFSLI